MSTPVTTEQLRTLSSSDLDAEDGRINAAIDELFSRRRLVRALLRSRDHEDRIIAKQEGKPEPARRLRTSYKPQKQKRVKPGESQAETILESKG